MVGPFLRALAASSFAVCLALPASAQDTVRVRGTVERIEGPVYIVKTRDGSEVKLVTTEDRGYTVAVKLDSGPGSLGVFGLVEMTVFIVILTLGLVYAWRKGVLRWA